MYDCSVWHAVTRQFQQATTLFFCRLCCPVLRVIICNKTFTIIV